MWIFQPVAALCHGEKLRVFGCGFWAFSARTEHSLGGGFQDFLFSPLPGEDFQFDEYFFKGLKTAN